MKRLFLLTLVLLIYGSLYPWHFTSRGVVENPVWRVLHSWPSGWNRFTLRDLAVNIAVYFPFGILSCLILARRLGRLTAWMCAGAGALVLSTSMELLQVYVPGRYPSLADVVSDGAGAWIGASAALLLGGRIRQFVPRPLDRPLRGPAILLGAWLVWQLYPFFPVLSHHRLAAAAEAFSRGAAFSGVDVFGNAAGFLAVAAAVHAIFGPNLWAYAGVLGVPAFRLLIVTRTMTPWEAAGAAGGVLLWLALPARLRLRAAAVLLGAAIVVRELSPFHFSSPAGGFSWVPLSATLEAERGAAVITLSRKAFEYGAEIWLLENNGVAAALAVGMVAGSLLLLELVQTCLPGRIPEVTDCLAAVLMGVALGRSPYRFAWRSRASG